MKNSNTIFICLLILLLASCQPAKTSNLADTTPPLGTLDVPVWEEAETTSEPEYESTATVIPTAVTMLTPETKPTNSPIATQTPSGIVNILSEPEGALVTVTNNNLSKRTPATWSLSPGMYTVTLVLEGYEPWTTPISVTAGGLVSVTATLRKHLVILPIADLTSPLRSIQWSDDGNFLIYALGDSSLPSHQTWWHYDIVNDVRQALPSPQTRVTNAVRESLGICPFPLPETRPYPCLPILWETPISDRIVFSSGNKEREAKVLLANVNGTDIVSLDMIPEPPADVQWSNDGQWLLIGYYNAVSYTYYLVSTDGTFVESLGSLTDTSHWRVQGTKPKFSPDGQKLVFVGIETGGKQLPIAQEDREDPYNTYVLNLNTMEHEMISPRFGKVQWAQNGEGLYILDGSANTAGNEMAYVLNDDYYYATLYYISLTQETYPEQKLADSIPIDLPSPGAWAYSPEANAMAGVFYKNGPVFSILSLR